MSEEVKTVGIIGAGKLGVTLAQLALKSGYVVNISGSGDPSKIALTVKIVTPGAKALNTIDAVNQSDVIILAMPLSKFRSLPVEALKNKLVIDAMNYWWEVDGPLEDIVDPDTSSSEMVQKFLPDSRIVKSFSHMGYHNLHDEAKPAGSIGRKALAIAGDNQRDVDTVASLVDSMGFDPVYIGDLANGVRLEPGSKAFGANASVSELEKITLI